jgi:hypothetical protein
MLRCASSCVIAAYVKIRLIPHDSRALPEPARAKAGGAFYEAVGPVVFYVLRVREE